MTPIEEVLTDRQYSSLDRLRDLRWRGRRQEGLPLETVPGPPSASYFSWGGTLSALEKSSWSLLASGREDRRSPTDNWRN